MDSNTGGSTTHQSVVVRVATSAAAGEPNQWPDTESDPFASGSNGSNDFGGADFGGDDRDPFGETEVTEPTPVNASSAGKDGMDDPFSVDPFAAEAGGTAKFAQGDREVV